MPNNGPVFYGDGEFELVMVFHLNSSTLPRNGTIVQNIRISMQYFDCETGRDITLRIDDSPVVEYSEAFSIEEEDHFGRRPTDKEKKEAPCGIRGRAIWEAVAHYYSGYQVFDRIEGISDRFGLEWFRDSTRDIYPTFRESEHVPWQEGLGHYEFSDIPIASDAHGLFRKFIVEWNTCQDPEIDNWSFYSISTERKQP